MRLLSQLIHRLKQLFLGSVKKQVSSDGGDCLSVSIAPASCSHPQLGRSTGPSLSPVVDHAPICPYCSHRFDTWPSRNRKCPACKNKIIIRTLQTGKTIVTENQAATIDAERKENAYRNKIMNLVSLAQISSEDFYIARAQNERTTGERLSDRDLAWNLIQSVATKKAQRKDYTGSILAWNAACWFRHLHGEDPSIQVAKRERVRLLDLKASGYKTVWIWTECRCPACSAIKHRVQEISAALSNQLLPVKGCETGRIISCGYMGDMPPVDLRP